jgi:hypothetical protein
MAAINKQAILDKTHYGLNIYSHILQSYYPGAIVLSLSGRTCAPARNPFNNDKPTLQVFIEKSDPSNALSAEFACHYDTQNAIPAGDAFAFAELHYKQSGEALLQTLNKELFLHIGEERSFYSRHCGLDQQPPLVPAVPNSPKSPPVGEPTVLSNSEKLGGYLFSFFKAPISNTKPHKAVSLFDIYKYIVGNYAKQRTEHLRAFADSKQARHFKAANFDYCTFSGVFTTRNDKNLVQHSGLMAVDFDHLPNLETLRQALLADEYFDTQLLFISPSDDGLKWIISVDTSQTTHGSYFAAVANYILQTYGVEVDKSGRDISRACFLPHDPQAFINPTNLK